jgi:hypothetical protein
MDSIITERPEKNEPLHLDIYSRNDRLYKYLLSVGLFVEPVFTDDSRANIDYLRVSAGLLLRSEEQRPG